MMDNVDHYAAIKGEYQRVTNHLKQVEADLQRYELVRFGVDFPSEYVDSAKELIANLKALQAEIEKKLPCDKLVEILGVSGYESYKAAHPQINPRTQIVEVPYTGAFEMPIFEPVSILDVTMIAHPNRLAGIMTRWRSSRNGQWVLLCYASQVDTVYVNAKG